MFSLLVFLVIIGILIVIHEFGHFIVAKSMGVRVECFSLGFGPRLLGKKIKETQYTLSAIPLGGYVKLAGDSLEEYKGKPYEYFSKKPGQRAMIIFCGPALNYLLGFLCFWLIFFVGYPTLTTRVGSVLNGYGAEEAGIQAGDKIIALNGEELKSWDDLQVAVFDQEPQSTVKVLVSRGGKEFNLNVKLKEKELQDTLGSKRNVGLLGITPNTAETVKIKYGLIKAFSLSAEKTWTLTVITYKAIWRMITGKLSLSKSVTGPIGIFYITSQAAHMGITALLNLIGLLSLSLAIFNLLPLPILDGGHILLLIIEKVRGRLLSIKTERVIMQTGLTIIITLALIVTYNDILKFKDKFLQMFIK